MEILRSTPIVQKRMRTVFTGKSFDTVNSNLVGMHFVLILINGLKITGIGQTESKAIENAKSKVF